MRTRVIGLTVATAMLACAGLGASGTASAASTSCLGTFRVHPGVGETFVSQIHVSGVTCAKAHFAIGRYEHSLKHTAPLAVSGATFTCTRTTIGLKSNGVKQISCRHGAQRVRWRSAYGI
jgi:hypothetical protein